MRVLTVDWDYFFPIVELDSSEVHEYWSLYDWGHREAAFFYEAIWPIRAAGFKNLGLELPRTSGEELTFWSRVNVDQAKLFVSDSHSAMADPAILYQPVAEIVSIDAHHDAGYGSVKYREADLIALDRVDCGNWIFAYHWKMLNKGHKIDITVRYPKWRSYAMKSENKPQVKVNRMVDDNTHLGTFDLVHICRSAAWTPPWLDQQFEEFVKASAITDITRIDYKGPRRWNEEMIEPYLEALRGVNS